MISMAGVPFTNAVRMITSSPARIMNVADRKGSLIEGKDADIVIFDADINIETTIIKGKVVYTKQRENVIEGITSSSV